MAYFFPRHIYYKHLDIQFNENGHRSSNKLDQWLWSQSWIAERRARLGTRFWCESVLFVIGEVSWPLSSHPRIASASYVKPSAATCGSRMTSCISMKIMIINIFFDDSCISKKSLCHSIFHQFGKYCTSEEQKRYKTKFERKKHNIGWISSARNDKCWLRWTS